MSISRAESAESGHLAYYRSQGISPVRYAMRSVTEHFERRDAMYRSLGLPEAAFRGCRVLEVAPGSGQNSLFVASARPAHYDLVEPNPAAIGEIRALYQQHREDVVAPKLHEVEFESFEPDEPYDIVLCENWLGSLPSERTLIRKLASLLVPGGVLVLTMVPYSGFLPNVMRRLLALRVVNGASSFADRTAALVEAFSPHLATIPNMTRSFDHWVQDCMLNPHYLNVALSCDTVMMELGSKMEILGSSPRFLVDWRWFKGLVGEERKFNDAFQQSYVENLHNFVDYRRVFPPRTAAQNLPIERLCGTVWAEALAWDHAFTETGRPDSAVTARISLLLGQLATAFGSIDHDLEQAFREVAAIWDRPTINASDVSAMGPFAALFGRETIYVSFTRRHS